MAFMQTTKTKTRTSGYLELLGVPDYPARTSAFDPGYDPVTLEGHLEQSAHLISSLKISMACWQVANEKSTVRKIEAARNFNIPVCTGGGPFEVAAHFGLVPEYLELCADLGISRIEAGEGFTKLQLAPREIVNLAGDYGLDVQYEVGEKHGGKFSQEIVSACINLGLEWLEAGALQIVIEARESAKDIGIFGISGEFDSQSADQFVAAFGLEHTIFEAPDKASQFALLNHFGPGVNLMNVRLEEILRVEIYRRGLHSDAFRNANLRPRGRLSGLT